MRAMRILALALLPFAGLASPGLAADAIALPTSSNAALPVQDSSTGYGGATRLLRFPVLTPERVAIDAATERLTGDLACDSHAAGLHTLNGCGAGLSLIDVKRIDRSRAKQWLDLKRRWRRLTGG